MAKRILSVLLAVLLVFATAAVAFADGDAAPGLGGRKNEVIFFNAASIGWDDAAYVGFHIWELGGDPFSDWGGKAERGTKAAVDSDPDANLWRFDFAAKGITLEDDKQYGVIFYNDKGGQTYNLLFDTTCFEDTADCDTTNTFENPEDSEKVAYPAYWHNQDPAVNGPELKITSIGNVVGSCLPKGTTANDLMEQFLKTTLDNARKFSDLGDQEIIDNIGKALGLNKAEVEDEIKATGVQTNWTAEKSTLPDAPAPITSDKVIHFDAKSIGWTTTSYIGFHIWEYGKDEFYDWGAKQQRGTDEDGDGVWSYDLEAHGITLDPELHYGVVFYNDEGGQTYDLLFDTTCFGDTAYCADDAVLENPVDSDKETQVAYWKNQDPTVNGPLMIVTTIGTVVGFCIPKGYNAFDLLLDFLKFNLETAEVYSGLTQHQLIENVARDLELTVEDVQDAIRIAGVTVDWDSSKSNLDHQASMEGAPTRVRITTDVKEGKGVTYTDKDYLLINYSLGPDYAYDTVTLTADPAADYAFVDWQIEGDYEIDGNYAMESPVLPIKAFGEISAHAVFVSTYDPTLRGDYDNDDEVTIMDATRAQRILAGLEDRPDDAILAAIDADGDKELTIMDATRIQRVLASLCDWEGRTPGGNPDELPYVPV